MKDLVFLPDREGREELSAAGGFVRVGADENALQRLADRLVLPVAEERPAYDGKWRGVLALALLTGCSATITESPVPMGPAAGSVNDSTEHKDSAPAEKTYAPPKSEAVPKETGERLYVKNSYAYIDYTDTAEGYVSVQYTAETEKRLKAQVKGPLSTYTYTIEPGVEAVFPLSEGNGSYKISIYENAYDSKYAHVLSAQCTVELANEFAPFLHSNQYVDFDAAPETVKRAAELTKDLTQPLEKVAAVYDYVVKGMTYDRQLAATVKSGYLPVLDDVLARKSGICFDYAALMTGMLRSQGVPCKLVVGYAGTAYHAWISVWSEESGWVDGAVFFNGHSWQRMDPTFASSGKQSASIMAYIGNSANYTAKYLY